MQTLRNMQGTKDTRGLGIVSNTICKGIFIWKQDDTLSYLILANDDIIFATNSTETVHLLETTFHTFFHHAKRKRAIEPTFSIIQSKHGISININLHYIKHNKLKEYILATIKVPFPLCPNF